MSDFLTRLVTATYQPAATVRPRPVAHYEPIGAVLPLWVEGEETPPPISAPPRQAPGSSANVPAKAPASPPSTPNPSAAPPLHAAAARLNSPMAPASAPRSAPPKVAAPLAAQTPNVIQPAPLPSIAVTEAPAPSSQPRAPLPPRAPLITPSHAHLAPPRPLQGEDVSKREGASRVTPTLAQGVQRVAEPLLIQVVVEPDVTQPATLPPRSAPPPVLAPISAPISAPRKPLDATQSAAPLPVTLTATLSETHRAAPERTRPADAFAPRSQPGISAPPRVAPAAVTPAAALAPPVIRVTIGRIVIKAEGGKPSKPAKPHPAPAKPALSLDAYLKSRRGGDA